MLKSELMDLLHELGSDEAWIYISMPDNSLVKIKKVSVDEDGDIILKP